MLGTAAQAAPGPAAALLPLTLAPAAITTATSTVGVPATVALGSVLVAPATVIGVGLLTGYAIGTAGSKAVSWAWDWAHKDNDGNNADKGYADPPLAVTTLNNVGTYTAPNEQPNPLSGRSDSAGGWTCAGAGFSCTGGITSSSSAVAFQLAIAEFTTADYRSVSFQAYVKCTSLWDGSVLATGAAMLTSTGSPWAATVNIAWPTSTPMNYGAKCTATVGSSDGYMTRSWDRDPGAPAPAGSAGTGATVLSTVPTSGCSDGSVVAGAAVTYTGATKSAELPPITYPACPEGSYRTSGTTPTTTPDGTAAQSPLPTWTAPVVPSGFPECQPMGRCQLVLLRHSPDGATLNCTGTAGCAGWMNLPRSAPGVTVRPLGTGSDVLELPRTWPNGDTMECRWGPYVLPVDECGSVATEEPAVPPGTGTGTGPEVPPVGAGCGGSWSMNPVNWVLNPVKCALQWAFGVSPETQARFAALPPRVAGLVPFSIVGGLGDWLTPIGTLTQHCPDDWVVKVGGQQQSIVCGQGFTEKLHDSRPVLLIMMIGLAVAPLAWGLWYAAVPALAVRPADRSSGRS